MAIKKLKAASPDKLLNKGADMKPVTTGQVNNQLIPSIDTDIDANGRLIKDNTSKIDLNTTAVAPLAGIAKGVFTSCAAAVSGGVTPGELYVLRQTYVISVEGENVNKVTDTIVLMPAECE